MIDADFERRLDAEHAAVLALIPPGLVDLDDIPGTRQRADDMLKAAGARHAPVPGVGVEDRFLPADGDRPELLIRFYTPEGVARPAPAMLYIHGGGYVLGTVEQFDMQCRQMAAGSGVAVASVEYRRAPEHPYPVPLEDCHAALGWLHAQTEPFGLDPTRIGIGGTSAGAGLAAGLALLARDRGSHRIAFQILEAPMLDPRGETPSSHAVHHPRVWNRAINQAAWTAYLGPGAPDGYAAPALAEDLGGLPPAYLCVGAHDLFVDEAADYAQRLRRAGVATEFHLYEMGFHGSQRVLPGAVVSLRWRADLAAAIRRLAG